MKHVSEEINEFRISGVQYFYHLVETYCYFAASYFNWLRIDIYNFPQNKMNLFAWK